MYVVLTLTMKWLYFLVFTEICSIDQDEHFYMTLQILNINTYIHMYSQSSKCFTLIVDSYCLEWQSINFSNFPVSPTHRNSNRCIMYPDWITWDLSNSCLHFTLANLSTKFKEKHLLTFCKQLITDNFQRYIPAYISQALSLAMQAFKGLQSLRIIFANILQAYYKRLQAFAYISQAFTDILQAFTELCLVGRC